MGFSVNISNAYDKSYPKEIERAKLTIFLSNFPIWMKDIAKRARHHRLGEIKYVQVSSGDPHNNGKRPLIITFKNGAKYVVKMRSMQKEQLFVGLVCWSRRSSCIN